MKKLLIPVVFLFCLFAGLTGEMPSVAESAGKDEAAGTSAPAGPAGQEQAGGSAELKAAKEESKKIIVARVNGAAITMEALVRVMNRIGAKKGRPAADAKEAEEVRKEALNRLILLELAYQRAKAEGLTVPQANIDKAISNVRENTGDEEGYRKFLQEEGVTEEELRQQVEVSLTVELLYAREVLGKVVVPEEEMKKEYEQMKDRFLKPEQVSVVDIFFLKKDDDKETGKKAEEVLGKLSADKDPWKLVLDGSFIVRNLNINKGKHKEIYEEARKMKAGELSGIIKASDGLHIVKLKEYSPERFFTFEEAKGSIEGKMRFKAQEKRLHEWEDELKKDAKIEIIETVSTGK